MRVIAPTPVTDAVLVSCTVPEADYPEWSSATAYSIGDRVMIAATHQTYEALTAHTNKPPATSPADWLPLGATNRWRMFDEKIGTLTSAAESISVTLAPGIATGVALFGVSASTVTVTMTDPVEGVVFSRTEDMQDNTGINSWSAYVFEPVRRKTRVIFEGLPNYRSAQLTISVTGGSDETVSIGSLVVGKVRKFADNILLGAEVPISDFSRKARDSFGSFEIVERGYSNRAKWSFIVDNVRLDWTRETLASLRSKPAVYIGSSRFSCTSLYGFFIDFRPVITYPEHSEVAIEIEELT